MATHVVVGAGIAGLAAAFHLVEEGHDVVVLEASQRAGGRIRTVHQRGVVLEEGPQTLQATGPALRLIGRLGLRRRVLWPDRRARRRYILHDDALHALPTSMAGMWRSPPLSRAQVLRLLAEPLAATDPRDGETLHQFASRRLGVAVADLLLDAFVAGVFAGDPRELEAASAFPRLVEMESGFGSLFAAALLAERPDKPGWAEGTMLTFDQGMSVLVDGLVSRLGGRILFGERVERVETTAAGVVVHAGGETYEADRCWMCVSPSVLHPEWSPPRATLATAQLVWPREEVRIHDGFGWLCPSSARRDVLGALWVTASFPSHAPGRAVVRVMMGGRRDPGAATLTDAAILERARRILSEVEGIDAAPEWSHLCRVRPGIPQYVPGHAARVARLQAASPYVRWLGWEVSGIGLSGVLAAAEQVTA
jgi:oxygen-dependent protoporphyrinogen oxidase